MNPGAAGARLIFATFAAYGREYEAITRRARGRFETRDWHGAQADARDRLQLYRRMVDRGVAALAEALDADLRRPAAWSAMKAAYRELLVGRADVALAETFFNSLSRRVFTTVGVDPAIEFVEADPRSAAEQPEAAPIFRRLTAPSPAALLTAALTDLPLAAPWRDQAGDVARAAARLAAAYPDGGPGWVLEQVPEVFYRGQGAYLVGRLRAADGGVRPLVHSLRHRDGGVVLDAVLLEEDAVSIVFSFTRAYFQVVSAHPEALVAFLKSILPHKRTAELYISLGYNKHGKTELYRDLLCHLAETQDRFAIAPGARGMVMIVFTLGDFDLVFKVIKDRPDPPKATTPAEVRERYALVFAHDRAGRLVDAQEFEHVRFERARFEPELLAELQRAAPGTVSLDGDCVVVRHLYVERRVTPLDLYLRAADAAAAQAAVLDYGQALKDLAASNIFPGDVLLKNFGVTRHGRVVFYDYDELSLLTELHFRRMPPPGSFGDEFAAEPFFYVGPRDIFPEEFRTFLGIGEPLRSVFTAAHGELFAASYWRGVQARLAAGELIEIFPYGAEARLGGEAGEARP
jgi:isocitrate dehydrogenase kinase/phosphatase